MTEANNKKIGLNPPGAKVVAGTAARYVDFEIVATEGESGAFKYYLNGDVVERAKRDEKGNFVYPVAICGRIEPVATFCDCEKENHGVRIRVTDTQGNLHELTFMRSELSQNPGGVAASLESSGLPIYDRKVRNGAVAAVSFLRLIAEASAAKVSHKTAATATGWIKSTDGRYLGFVLPDGIITPGASSDYIFVPFSKKPAPFAVQGSLSEWQKTVGRWSRASQYTAFALMVAFASPLIRLAGLGNNTVFNMWGESSKGKTTTLKVAASVFGKGCARKDDAENAGVYTWNTTANFNEVAAEQHNDLPFIVDELGDASKGALESLAYMVGNGQGRGRMGPNGEAQRVRNFSLLGLSAAEYSYVDLKQKQGLEVAPGELVRVVDVYATGCEYGLFWAIPKIFQEHKTEDKTPAEALADGLSEAAKTNYGVAGREFMRRFVAEYLDGNGLKEKFREDLKAFSERLHDRLLKKGEAATEALEGRVFRAFALVGFAGQKAVDYGVLPEKNANDDGWGTDEALGIAAAVFKAWKTERETEEEKRTRWALSLISLQDEVARVYTDAAYDCYATGEKIHAASQPMSRKPFGKVFKKVGEDGVALPRAVIFDEAEFKIRTNELKIEQRAIISELIARRALIGRKDKHAARKKYRAPNSHIFDLTPRNQYYVIDYVRVTKERETDDSELLNIFTGGAYI